MKIFCAIACILFFIQPLHINATKSVFTKEGIVITILSFFAVSASIKQFDRTRKNNLSLKSDILQKDEELVEQWRINSTSKKFRDIYCSIQYEIDILKTGQGYVFNIEQYRNTLQTTCLEEINAEKIALNMTPVFDVQKINDQKKEINQAILSLEDSIKENFTSPTTEKYYNAYQTKQKEFREIYKNTFPAKSNFDQTYCQLKTMQARINTIDKNNKRTESIKNHVKTLDHSFETFNQKYKKQIVSMDNEKFFENFNQNNKESIDALMIFSQKHECSLCYEETSGIDYYGACKGAKTLCSSCFSRCTKTYKGTTFCCPFCRGVIEKNNTDYIITCKPMSDEEKPKQEENFSFVDTILSLIEQGQNDHVKDILDICRSNIIKIAYEEKIDSNSKVESYQIKKLQELLDTSVAHKEQLVEIMTFAYALQTKKTAQTYFKKYDLEANKNLLKIIFPEITSLDGVAKILRTKLLGEYHHEKNWRYRNAMCIEYDRKKYKKILRNSKSSLFQKIYVLIQLFYLSSFN